MQFNLVRLATPESRLTELAVTHSNRLIEYGNSLPFNIVLTQAFLACTFKEKRASHLIGNYVTTRYYGLLYFNLLASELIDHIRKCIELVHV